MINLSPITKTLKRATPTIRTSDNVVKQWQIEVIYSFDGDETHAAWKSDYSHQEDVEYLGKTAEQFTKSELIGFMPTTYENHIFNAHYESIHFPPKEETLRDFDISTLGE